MDITGEPQKMSKSKGNFITLHDLKWGMPCYFVNLPFIAQEALIKLEKKVWWRGLPFWEKILWELPKIRIFRTYPFGFEIVITYKDCQFDLFNFFTHLRSVKR